MISRLKNYKLNGIEIVLQEDSHSLPWRFSCRSGSGNISHFFHVWSPIYYDRPIEAFPEGVARQLACHTSPISFLSRAECNCSIAEKYRGNELDRPVFLKDRYQTISRSRSSIRASNLCKPPERRNCFTLERATQKFSTLHTLLQIISDEKTSFFYTFGT